MKRHYGPFSYTKGNISHSRASQKGANAPRYTEQDRHMVQMKHNHPSNTRCFNMPPHDL